MHFLKNTPNVFFVRLSFLHMKNLKVVPIPLLQLVYLAGQNNLKQSWDGTFGMQWSSCKLYTEPAVVVEWSKLTSFKFK